MTEKEKLLVNYYKDQASEASSYTTKYAIVDLSQLLVLIQSARTCCEKCQQQLHVTDIQQQEHATILMLECAGGCNLEKQKWTSSEQYADGTFQVNREAVCAVMVTGGEREKYLSLCKEWRIGHVNKNSFDKYVDLLAEVVFPAEKQMYEENIKSVNEVGLHIFYCSVLITCLLAR